MILVATGTFHLPFDRLVAAAATLAVDDEVIVQAGTSVLRPVGCEVVDVVGPDAFVALVARARVVVCHGGPGVVTAAWDHGLVPVVVPRRPEIGEHVDDHQIRWTRALGDRVVRCEDPRALRAAVATALEWSQPGSQGPRADPPAARGMARLATRLVQRGARRGGRARLPGARRP